ncbi:unnamed protein product [Nyctereutes procyonoides]|uniref:40S ribosomal protein SA n=1 Tax=Nyctereutes procyonoides TaxID=34880 RepID=A0A811ZQX9_NYCPR|nr:unnamed protein product [Nyctereutes procyonoides]
MSRALDVLQMEEEDVLKFLAAGTHLGGTNLDFQMEQYIYKKKCDGIYIINLKRTWEKLLLAARAIVAIENPANVSVISSRNTGQFAVLKFTAATGATPIAGHFTSGNLTNQIQAGSLPRAKASAHSVGLMWWMLAQEVLHMHGTISLHCSQPEVADWSEGMQVPSVPIQQFPTEDWSTQPATED